MSSGGRQQPQRFTSSRSGAIQQQQTQGRQVFDQQLQHEQAFTRSHSAPSASVNNENLMPSSHYQQHSFTPPPSRELLVALLREQRSPEIERGKTLSGAREENRMQQNHSDDDGYQSGSESTDSAMQLSEDHAMEDANSSRTSLPSVKIRQQLTRSAKAAASTTLRTTGNADSGSIAASNAAAGSAEKRSRYLREVDRRSIIHRIDRGEKQSELAKEFGVTRAAICHINKNRVEILTRSTRADVHSNARHPKRGMYSTTTASAPMPSSSTRYADAALSPAAAPAADIQPSVFEVSSPAMALLMTKLRRRETESCDFHLCTDRAFRLLLEEALVRVPTHTLDIATPNDFVCEGLSKIKPSCGVSISEEGFALLQIFRSIQPTSPSGFITLNATAIHEGISTEPTLQKVCIPPDLRAYDVFLLEATCATGAGACVVIQALLDFGAQEAAIHLVCLLASAVAVSEICSRFPAVRIVTGAVDPEVSDGGGNAVICPGLGNFTERYFNATVVHHTSLGTNIES